MPFTGGPEFQVNQTTSGEQKTSNTPVLTESDILERPTQALGMDANGNLIITWSSQGQDDPTGLRDWGVYARRYNAATRTWGNEFIVNPPLTGPNAPDFQGNQLASAVAMDEAGNFIITWTSDSRNQNDDPNSYGVYAQRYSLAGAAIGTAFRINATTASDQTDSSIAIDPDGGSGFVVTWTSRNQDASGGRGIYARRYNPDGTPKDPTDLLVNTFVTGDQLQSTVAMAADGSYVIVWESFGQLGTGASWDVFGQRFNADGTKAGGEFLVNTFTANSQRGASVSMDATGAFVVSWTSTRSGFGNEIYAQRYTSTGAPIGSEFNVSAPNGTGQFGDERESQVKLLKNSGFIITWTGTDSNGTGVYARRYNASGNALPDADGGIPFLINQTATGNQGFAAVGADSSGNFSVAWTTDQAGDSDVFNRIFTVAQTPTNPPTDINLIPTKVNENVAPGTIIGTLTSVDPDLGDTFTYTLVAGTGDTDNAAFTIVNNGGVFGLSIISSPDYEVQKQYSVRVRSTDSNGLTYEEALTVDIIDLNEPPTDVAVTPNLVNENVPLGTVVGTLSTVDQDIIGTIRDSFTYSIVTDPRGPDGGSFQIIGDKLVTNAPLDFETKNSYTIVLETTDAAGNKFARPITVNIGDVNENPTAIQLSNTSINENVPAGSVVGTLTGSDPDFGNAALLVFSLPPSGADNAAFTIVGRQLQIRNSPDFETKPSYSIVIRTTDPGGLTFDQAFTITIIDVPEIPNNQAPTNVVLTPPTVDENVAAGTAFGTLTTVDPDAGDTFTYSLVAGAGADDNAAFTIVGDRLRINNTPDFEAKSSYTVRIRTTDRGGLSFERQLAVNVNDINEPPTSITLAPDSLNEFAPPGTQVGTLTATDTDRNDSFTFAFVAGLGDTDNGSFALTSDGKLSIAVQPDFETKPSYSIRVQVTDRGGLTFARQITVNITDEVEPGAPTDLTLSSDNIDENKPPNSVIGTLAGVDPVNPPGSLTFRIDPNFGDAAKFTINASNQLVLIPSADFETQPNYSVRVITTNPANLSFARVFAIRINDINEPPTALALSATEIVENSPADSVVGNLITTDPDANDAFTYSLVAGGGDTNNAAFRITGGQLRLVGIPDFETRPSYSVRIRTTDRGGLFFEQAFTITVRDVGEPPSELNLSATNIDENVPINSVVGTLTTVDPDLPNDSFVYSLVSDNTPNDNASFRIANDQLQIITSPNFEVKPSYAVRIRTTDKDGLFLDRTFIIKINDINEPPVAINLSSTSVAENVPPNSLVGTLTTSDPDIGDTFTYAFVAGAGSTDNAAFALANSNGVIELRIRNTPDFEAKPTYSIRLRTTDAKGLFFEQSFTIRIIDINELPGTNPPTDLLLNNDKIDENRPANTVVGVFSSIDPDQNEVFTYSFVPGAGSTDNAAFRIVGNELRINAIPDYETQPRYSIRVRTTDKGGLFFERIFTITVNDLPETPGTTTPQDLLLSNNQIAENQPANTAIGSFTTIDPDIGDSFIYSLVSGQGSDDNTAFTIVGDQLKINAIPDFETKSRYTVRVRTTDVGGLFFERAFTVIVTDLPETPGTNPPQNLLLSNNSIEENRPVNSPIGTFSTIDPDAGDTFTYSLVTGDGSVNNAAFTIVNNELRLSVVPDFETKPSYSIRVRTTDVGGLFFEKIFTIRIIDLPENPGDTAPTNLLLSRSDIDENVPPGTAVGTLITVDPDLNDTFTYSLVPGFGDNAAFTIVGDQLRINVRPNFQIKPVYTVQITTTDSGNRPLTKTLTITVNDVNDPPIVTTSSGNLDYQEGSGPVAIDTGLTVTDFDSPNLVGGTVRLIGYVPGQDELSFTPQPDVNASFDAATGVLTLTGTTTLGVYQTILRSVTYSNSSTTPSIAPRTIQYVVSDGNSNSNLASRTIQVTPVNTAPLVVTSGGGVDYTEGTGELSIDPGIIVSDSDSPNLTSATIQLVGYVQGEDRLNVTPQTGLTSNFDAARGRLLLTGNAPVARYQAALRSVTYVNSSASPSLSARTVQFVVRDASLTSNVATRAIQVIAVESPTIITTSRGSLAYMENAGKVAIDPLLTVQDADSNTATGARVQLQGYLPNQDSLSVTLRPGITSNFDAATGALTLTGAASLLAYETVLRSVTYINNSDNPSTANRAAQFTVQNNGINSNLASRAIQVIPVNDPPLIQPSVPEISFSTGALLVDPNLSLTDVDSPRLTGATVSIGSFIAGEDGLLFTGQSGITGSFNPTTGILQLSGSATVAAYQTALRSVRYANSKAIPTGTPRSVTFQATDGAATSPPAAVRVQVLPSGIVPPIDLNGSAAGGDYISTFLIAGGPVSIVASDARFSQAYPVFTAARVQIANPLDGANELLSVDTTGTAIVATYDAARGVLNLTGQADQGQYIQVLRTVKYQNTAPGIDATTRSILFTISNGKSTSEPAQTRVQISQINLATSADQTFVTTPATDLIATDAKGKTVISTLQNLRQNDVITGGASRDRFMLMEGGDPLTIDLNDGFNQVGGIPGTDTRITGFESFQLTGYSAAVTLLGTAQDETLIGGSGSDSLFGNAGNDVLGGNPGNDRLDGGLGNDQMEGGFGDDFYVVDSQNDLVIEAANQGFDTVQSSVNYTLSNNVEKLMLTGQAANGGGNALDNQITGNGLRNSLQGEAGNDLLDGGSNQDNLSGGAGNDRLIGGIGQDLVTGGQGKDIFVLTAARKNSRDTIRDFFSKDDTMQVSRAGFSRNLRLGKLRADQFRLGAAAQTNSDRFIYNRGTGNLFFDADGVGGTAQVQIARLSNRAAITRSDIVVVNL